MPAQLTPFWVSVTACVCLLAAVPQPAYASSKSTVAAVEGQALASWESAVYKAAEAAVDALNKQSGAGFSLHDVPLETLQVYTGRQHHIGLSIDGVQYELVVGSEQEMRDKLTESQAQQAALPPGQGQDASEVAVPTGLVRQHWQSQDASSGGSSAPLTLPDVTLSGPLELRLTTAAPLRFMIPHSTEAGQDGLLSVRLGPGVTVAVSGLRSLQLRRPLDLPNLPLGYLAEVYAHAKLGTPGEGFDQAPGIHYLASQLRQLALNASIPLLTIDVAPASERAGVLIRSVSPDFPAAPPPRLKLRALKGGIAELNLRQGQVMAVGPGTAHDVVQQAASLARLWAWPLPHVDMSALVPYEALLRSILSAHPFDLMKVQRRGISLKLTKSEIKATRLMAFEMEVRHRLPPAGGHVGQDGASDDSSDEEWDDGGTGGAGGSPWERLLHPTQARAQRQEDVQVMVFDVVVSVRDKSGPGQEGVGGAKPDLVYVPISVKLREVHGPTLSMSNAAFLQAITGQGDANATAGNPPTPGYEHEDLGLARREAD